ncbi:MAG: T9SS type A sorting domain-containing protein [Flavobacteriales bacterium]|nr:T9SS type A sorting domain-containing protein [Flavobacteriales bacterium]
MRWTFAFVWLCLVGNGTATGQTPVDHSRQDFGELLHRLRIKYDSLIAAGDTLEIFREGGDYTKFKKWESQWSLRISHGQPFEEFMAAEQAGEAILPDRKAHAKSNQDMWHEVGPLDKPYSDVPYGLGNQGQRMEPGIGPVHFITICEEDPDLMLCGSALGGLFYRRLSTMSKWQNAGSDQWLRSPCRHAVFKVDDPNVWYAANSEHLGFVRGIYRKNLNDLTLDMIADHSDLGEWNKIAQLQTDPDNADVLYAATWDGLFRSTNVNEPDPTWVKIMLPAPTNDLTYGDYTYLPWQRIHDIAIEPGNGQHLYVAVMFSGEKTVDVGGTPTVLKVEYWRLLQSFDAGANWVVVSNMPSTNWVTDPDDPSLQRNHRRINIETSMHDPELLYVMLDIYSPPWAGKVYRVSDLDVPASTTWTHLADNQVVYGDGYGYGVSQTTFNDIYIGHSDRYKTALNVTTVQYGNLHANAEQYHVDVEDFVGHPTQAGEVWMANHGGVHRSTDDGANWEWLGHGLGVAEVYRMADSYSEPGRIALGLYHDGVVLSDDVFAPDWVPSWRQLGGLDGQRPLIHPIEGNRIYWNSQHNYSSFNYRSADYGVNRTLLNSPGSTDWNTDWALHRRAIGVLFTHRQVSSEGQEIRRSLDNGSTWEDVSNFHALNSTMPDFLSSGVWRIYRPWSAPDQLWAHVIVKRISGSPDIQKLYRTMDAQASAADVLSSWEEMAFPMIPDPDDLGAMIPRNTGHWIADLDFDHSNPNVAWIAYSSDAPGTDATGRHMLFRMDYSLAPTDPGYQVDYTGSSDNALPNAGIGWDALVLERGSNGGVYLGTDMGVFYTNAAFMSDGTEWVHLGLGLPRVRIQGLEINYQVNKVRAGLQGRGVWEHNLYCPEFDELIESGTYGANAFIESLSFIESTAEIPSGMEVNYRGGSEVRLLPGFRAEAGSRFHAFIHPCNGPGNSFKMMPYQGTPTNDVRSWNATATSKLKVYPNPSMGSFTIEHLEESPIVRVDLCDAQGRVVPLSWRSAHDGRLLCESGLLVRPGIYVVRTVTENGRTSKGSVHIQH